MGGAYVPSGIQWVFLAGLGILQMGLPYVLFAHGLKHIAGHEATGIGLIEPLLVPLWVYLAWGDQPAWWTLAGGALILVGLAIRFLEPNLAQRSHCHCAVSYDCQSSPRQIPRDQHGRDHGRDGVHLRPAVHSLKISLPIPNSVA